MSAASFKNWQTAMFPCQCLSGALSSTAGGQGCQPAPPASAVLLVYARAALHSHLVGMQSNGDDSAEGNGGLRVSMRQLEDCLCKCIAMAKVSCTPALCLPPHSNKSGRQAGHVF